MWLLANAHRRTQKDRQRLLLLLQSGGKSASGLRLYRKCSCTQNGSEWLLLEPCGLFKDAAFCLKGPKTSIRELTHPTVTNWAEYHNYRYRERTVERVEEKEEKGTKSSPPPPPSLSQLPGWPATNNKTRAEEHLLLRLKKRIKERGATGIQSLT